MSSSAHVRNRSYTAFDREGWQRLRDGVPLTLDEGDLVRLRGVGDEVGLSEVRSIYLPLSRLLSLWVASAAHRRAAVDTFLGGESARPPFVIGIAGPVAVGKSTTARILRELLSRWPAHPRVCLVSTDGFLRPNSVLEERGILHRKGFPESYDQRALIRFLALVKAGHPEVQAPVYSHLHYDVLPDETVTVGRVDILIIEGLNVLQPSHTRPGRESTLAVSDFFDFSLYVDARPEDLRRWYIERFDTLRETAFRDPASYFHRYATLPAAQARAQARQRYREINEVNLTENIQPTRGRATVILRKGSDHAVRQVLLRTI